MRDLDAVGVLTEAEQRQDHHKLEFAEILALSHLFNYDEETVSGQVLFG